MRIINTRLIEMLPELRVFLDVDVDGLELAQLEAYIGRSRTVLVYCSSGYFQSRNCMRELRAAVAARTPLVALMESEPSHGGLTMAEVRRQLAQVQESYDRWRFVGGPSSSELVSALFAHEPIEWNRLGPYQDATLRLIAERLLPSVAPGSTYVRAERTSMRRAHGVQYGPGEVVVFCSAHNLGVAELMAELTKATGVRLAVRGEVGDLARCDCCIVYLHARTWDAATRDALAAEVSQAIATGTPLLLAHEMPGLDDDDERHACAFSDLFAESATPEELRRRGIYAKVAVPLKGGALRPVGMALLAKELVAAAGDRARGSDGLGASARLRQWVGRLCGHRHGADAASSDGQQLLVSKGGRQIVVPSERVRAVELSSVLSGR